MNRNQFGELFYGALILLGIGGLAVAITFFEFKKREPTYRYDLHLEVAYALADYYEQNEGFPASKDDLIIWLEGSGRKLNRELWDTLEVNWGASYAEFMAGNVRVIKSVSYDVDVGIALDPILRRQLNSSKSNAESGRREILTPAPHTTGRTAP